MYDLVAAVRSDRPVTLVRLVEARGMSSGWPGAVAAVDGETITGSLLAGAANEQLPALRLGLHDLRISDDAAAGVGLSCGGYATVFVQPAGEVPARAWQRFEVGRPVTLVTDLDGTTPGATIIRDDSRIGQTQTRVIEEDGVRRLVAAYRPRTRLVIVGEGLLSDALQAQGNLLGWACEVTDDPQVPAGLGPSDGVIVLFHDDAVDVAFLAAALRSSVGYLGALGSHRTQQRRAAALRERGITEDELAAIHGPAGLDIGAATPPEIALAVVAELLVTVRDATAMPLRDRGGPIHR